MKFVYFLLTVAAGFVMLKFHKWIVDHTTRFHFAEQYLGPGGTYSFYKFAGVALMAGAFYYLTH